jgi:hypothetical protein
MVMITTSVVKSSLVLVSATEVRLHGLCEDMKRRRAPQESEQSLTSCDTLVT